MKVKTQEFTSMKGHVAHECVIVAPSGKEYMLINTIRGWVIVNGSGSEITGYLTSAHDVEYFVVNGLGSN